MHMFKATALAATLMIGTVSEAGANPGLANERDLNAGLLAASVADKIRRECSTIGARFFRARAFANQLKENAMKRGYSESEIEAYVSDKANQRAMRERRNAWMKTKGASNLDPASLCVLGHAEIARNSQVGYLLKAK